tara:strand:+ start:218 stop:634 length:417 start_codon:yes stop_codon:yes gene_type:complete
MVRSVWNFRFPPVGPYDAGVQINNGAGYAAAETGAMTVDDDYSTGDARDVISVGDNIWVNQSGTFTNLGICTAIAATTVTVGGGITIAVSDNDILYVEDSAGPLYGKMLNTGVAPSANTVIEVNIVRGEIVYTVATLA